jgi:hypothetical protein
MLFGCVHECLCMRTCPSSWVPMHEDMPKFMSAYAWGHAQVLSELLFCSNRPAVYCAQFNTLVLILMCLCRWTCQVGAWNNTPKFVKERWADRQTDRQTHNTWRPDTHYIKQAICSFVYIRCILESSCDSHVAHKRDARKYSRMFVEHKWGVKHTTFHHVQRHALASIRAYPCMRTYTQIHTCNLHHMQGPRVIKHSIPIYVCMHTDTHMHSPPHAGAMRYPIQHTHICVHAHI